MNKKEKVNFIINTLESLYAKVPIPLNHNDSYTLLIAVLLSARCTDKRVNIITKQLFEEIPNAQVMAASPIDAIFDLIKSCSYPRNKAKHLSGMAKMLMKDFEGEVPDNLDDLQKLPGVGRKTANVVGSVYFDIPAMPVDTHVFRVSERIGLTIKAKNPLQAELQLLKLFPKNKLNIAHHWLILHGRYVCKARKPDCINCNITHLCKYFSKK